MPKMTRNYKMPHRRRREKRTDYRRRLGLIKSGKVRLVIRKSSSHMNVQFISYVPEGDSTIVSVSSQELKKHGWNCGCGNIPGAYLTGLLAGIMAKGKISEAVIDMGNQMSTKGSRIYAALKGVLDSGISVPHDPAILPDDSRTRGEHIASWSEKATSPSFSKYKTSPKDIPKNFEETKEKIMKTVSK